MLQRIFFVFLLTLGLFILCPEQTQASAVDAVQEIEAQTESSMQEGLAISESLTRITGTAIYPVFGLAIIGLWDDLNGSDSWYASPFIYVPLLIFLVLEILKNTVGISLGPLKKPIDAGFQAVDFLNANLGLFMSMGFAMDTFQPAVATTAQMFYSSVIPTAHAAGASLSVFEVGGAFVSVLAALCGAAIYIAIWLTSQTFDLLIFLCPFTFIDIFLKTIKKFLVASLFLAFAVFPPLAVLMCLMYLIVSLLLFGFCVRYCLFGFTMIFHTMFKRGKGSLEIDRGILCFSDVGFKGVPKRTRGYLVRKEEQIFFQYKSFFLFSKECPVTLNELYLVEGTIYPMLDEKENGWGKTWFNFTTAYRDKEADLAKLFGCSLGAGLLLKGFRASINYIKMQYLNWTTPKPEPVADQT